MLATLQLEVGNGNGGTGLDLLPGTVVDAILHHAIELLACSIRQMEDGVGFIVEQELICQLHTQRLLTIAKRQRQASVMGLACSVSHIGRYLEVIEHRITGFWHLEGHGDFEATILACRSLTLIDFYTIRTIIQGAHLPVSVVRRPPEGNTARHLIADLSPLHRHTSESLGLAFHRQCVACRIGLLHFWEVNVECWALVFLHTDIVALVIHQDGKLSRQS